MTSLKKRYNLNWMFEAPEAILTCSILRCEGKKYLVFGGHDRTLYLMDEDMQILDSIKFDGWVRCTYPIDLTGDGCEEILIGAGDGNFLAVKFVKGINKLATIMNYKSSGKVLCVTAGDFTRDGNIELIEGGEDKTLKIFEGIEVKEPKFILYYDSWCTSCVLGYLKLSNFKNPIHALVVGTKNGLLQLIQAKDGKPDIIWQRDVGSQINSIDIGDVTNDGFNEIVLGTDNSVMYVFNADGEILKTIEIENGRPISLKIIDIDGDNAKEIIVGCADGSLRVYHNKNINSNEIELKWKTSAANSIKIISPLLDESEGCMNIVFGGYDRSLRCISDCEFGKKPALKIEDKMGKVKEVEEIKESTEPEEKPEKIKIVPTNLREYILKYLEDNNIVENMVNDLEKIGYTRDSVLAELESIRTEQSKSFEKVTYSVWELSEEQIGEGGGIRTISEKKEKKMKEVSVESETKSAVIDLIEALQKDATIESQSTPQVIDENLRYIILHYFEKNRIVRTKTKLINDIVILGYNEELVESLVDLMVQEGLIQYSPSDPRGWFLAYQE